MRKYDDEFKRNVLRKVFDGQSVSSISREIGVNESLIHKWKRVALDNGDGIKSGAELAEAAALKKRIQELEQENAHSKKGGADLRQMKLARYKFIDKEKAHHPVKVLCRVMRVGVSAYYAYALGRTYRGTAAQQQYREKVRTCFFEHRRRYGSRRIAAELKIGRFKARSAMKQAGLRAIAPKRFEPITTDSRHDWRISPYLLQNGVNAPTDKGQVIVGDITYLPLRNGGFCYLACFQDKYTRRIIGWQVSNRMMRQLVLDALNQGLRRGLIRRGAIIHTDRGSQYASAQYRRLLYINGFRQSMSRRGNCYDNAQAESFFSRFKAELVENGVFELIADAKSEVFSYIEGYYNRIRLHSSLGYKSPMQFENELNLKNKMRGKESFVCGKT